nr:unnamed protein product [Callosobruchus analis]
MLNPSYLIYPKRLTRRTKNTYWTN